MMLRLVGVQAQTQELTAANEALRGALEVSGARLAEERVLLGRWAAKVCRPQCPRASSSAACSPSRGRISNTDGFPCRTMLQDL